jgi:hypothetical protein
MKIKRQSPQICYIAGVRVGGPLSGAAAGFTLERRAQAVLEAGALNPSSPARIAPPRKWRRVRVRRVPLPAVANSRRGKQYRAKLTRLATKPTNKHTRVVDSLGRRYCQSVRVCPCSNGYLDRCAKLDGNGVHSQRKAVRPHSLPLHRPLLSRNERASSCAWFWRRLHRNLRLAGIGSRHSARKQAPLVGDRACLGQILLRQWAEGA